MTMRQCLAAEFLDKMLLGFKKAYLYTWKEQAEVEERGKTDTNYLHSTYGPLHTWQREICIEMLTMYDLNNNERNKKKRQIAYKSD